MLYQNAHVALAAVIGDEAKITDAQAELVADAYVTCEEAYGWYALDKYMPLTMLAITILSVEMPIIKRAITPRIMAPAGKGKSVDGQSRAVPGFVTK